MEVNDANHLPLRKMGTAVFNARATALDAIILSCSDLYTTRLSNGGLLGTQLGAKATSSLWRT